MKPLHGLGADEVIPEEFETSVEIFTRVLMKYLIPRDEIDRLTAVVRSDGYEMFRSITREPPSFHDLKLHIPDIEIITLRVGERSPIVGRSLAQIELRRRYEVTLLAIRRDSQTFSNPHGDMELCAGDLLFVLGQAERIAGIMGLLQDPEEG